MISTIPFNVEVIFIIFMLAMINWITFFVYLKVKHKQLLKKFTLKDPFNNNSVITFYNPLKFGKFLLQIRNEPDPTLKFFKITHLILIIIFGGALILL